MWADPQGDVSPPLLLLKALPITCHSPDNLCDFVSTVLETLLYSARFNFVVVVEENFALTCRRLRCRARVFIIQWGGQSKGRNCSMTGGNRARPRLGQHQLVSVDTLMQRLSVKTAPSLLAPFSSHFYFVKESIETISWQYGVNFLVVNSENGANIASLSRMWACVTRLLPRRVRTICILISFVMCSQPRSLCLEPVYAKTSRFLGVYISSVAFRGTAPPRAGRYVTVLGTDSKTHCDCLSSLY